MTAFERINCGIPDLDQVFDNIRLGDNVVWQLSDLNEFHHFVDPFVRQALADKRNLIYMRFASHEPLVAEQPGVKVYEFNPHRGFETFTVEVRNVITKEGRDAFYVFDCLSELQAAWSADMMMANFFRLTCPYLFQLDTVAYFPVIRGKHSFATIAKIRDTTQLLIDVCPDEGPALFIHPLKVWNRYSPSMFMGHRFDTETGQVSTLTDGVETARFYARMNDAQLGSEDQNSDSWDRFFNAVQQKLARGEEVDEKTCDKMCNMMMTKDERLRTMVRRYFGPADYLEVRNRMVDTGLIGGKACGMLLARKIVESELPEAAEHLEPHDSFYIGTDVFYTYIVANDLWIKRIHQRSESGFVSEAPAMREGLLAGSFPDDIRERFRRILEYYGQAPIIVRSSSFLEDGFGNAFAGKYESVFCPNTGSPEERLEDFENAIRQVYASMMDPSALEYRRANGLDKHEEQMALLVQRVSGSHYGDVFMPTAAGVGYSHNTYCWMDGMDPDAGMLRLVMGLGTKAVDRTSEDYPRIVSLDRPLATTAKTVAERHRFSQRNANVIDLAARKFDERTCDSLLPLLPEQCVRVLFEHDTEAEAHLRERGQFRPVLFASCDGLVKNHRFTQLMREVLATLQKAYDNPVDIEFTVNVGDNDRFVFNLLQCRPLRPMGEQTAVTLPDLLEERTLLHLKDSSMGNSRMTPIDTVIFVDPQGYHACPYVKKSSVARLIGKVNAHLKERGGNTLLLTPGRVGTSSPDLGVPVSFYDISGLSAICEVAYGEEGFSPELSYGSHMFQDLVEADIFYGAVFRDGRTLAWNPALITSLPDRIGELLGPDASIDPEIDGIVHVLDTHELGLVLWHDMMRNETVCGIDG